MLPKTRKMFSIILSFSLLFSINSIHAKKKKQDDNTITVIGESPIYHGDKQNAKQRAIKDAKVSAVRKLIGEQITEKTGVSDGESLGSKLLSKTDAFVKSYNIIDETVYKMDTTDILKLTVRCEVEKTRLSTEVESLLSDIGNPKIMVLVKGSANGKQLIPGSVSNKAEVMITNELKKNQSNVININVARQQIAKNQGSLKNLTADSEVANSPIVKMGQDAGADVLIIGELEITKQPSIQTSSTIRGQGGSTFYSSAATLTYRIVLLWGDGKELPGGSLDARGADITQDKANDKATLQAASRVGQGVSKTLKDEWFKLTENNAILLRFKGLSPEEATRFADDLKEFTAIKDVNQRTTNTNGSEWEVTYPGKASMLSEELTYKKESGFSYIGKKEMNIVSAERGIITLSFTPVK